MSRLLRSITHFYPRSPCGERPASRAAHSRRPQFLSTLSLRRATLRSYRHDYSSGISIHALLAESDGNCQFNGAPQLNFYPRSPCGERPARTSLCVLTLYFYPRSPCGERRQACLFLYECSQFLSTLSLRRATDLVCAHRDKQGISIHALLAESDIKRYCLNNR